jgi:UDP-galactopyranose mutase
LEEWILDKIGPELYHLFIEGYTAKQWGKHPRELPSSIIKRLPIRLTDDDRYFADNYQGIPTGGYTKLFENMLDGIDIVSECDYLTNRERLDRIAHKVVYTGPIDDFFDHCFGSLEWRSLHFDFIRIPESTFQASSIVNYPSSEIKYTRIVEYKHFDPIETKDTIISVEYPLQYKIGSEKYYPVNTKQNLVILDKYNALVDRDRYIFGGRLAEYKYYDMHQVIASAIHKYQLATRR